MCRDYPPYSGHPSCPAVFLRDAERFSPPGCMMLPLVTPALENKVADFLADIASADGVEISVNDWGTLYRCASLKKQGRLNASLTAGVLLMGQDTDPMLCTWESPSFEAVLHMGTPSVFGCAELLHTLCVSRIEVCAQPFPFPERPAGLSGLPVTCFAQPVVSVFPCGKNCSKCTGGIPSNRGGQSLFHRQNLVLSESGFIPDYADRILLF